MADIYLSTKFSEKMHFTDDDGCPRHDVSSARLKKNSIPPPPPRHACAFVPHARYQCERSVEQQSLDWDNTPEVCQTDYCTPHSVSGVGFSPVWAVHLHGSSCAVWIPGSPGVSSHTGISPHRPGGTEPIVRCIYACQKFNVT